MAISVKKNFIYNTILTNANYVFAFITFPYVTRVLGVDKIGVCNFVDSIIQYFVIFSMLGISIIGTREIAKVKDDKDTLNETFSELIFLNLSTTLVSIIILLSAIFIVPQLWDYKILLFVGVAKILASSISIEWLFNGLENFRYITLRSIIIKICYVASVFIFVKAPDDYVLYFILTVLLVAIGAIVNIVYSRNFVKLRFKGWSFFKYLKPNVTLGFFKILTSMYTTFNITYLGFATNTIQVGYYTTATKLYTILFGVFSALVSVMLPRMSALIKENRKNEILQMIGKTTDALFAFAFPVIIIVEICASQIVYIIAGSGYEGAISTMRIIIPLILLVGYTQILVFEIFMPTSNDKIIMKNAMVGSVVGLTMNILVVSHYGSDGSAIAWIISELFVLIVSLYYAKKFWDVQFPLLSFSKRLTFYIPIVIICFIINSLIQNVFLSLILISLFVFAGSLFIEIKYLKNEIIESNFKRVFKYL